MSTEKLEQVRDEMLGMTASLVTGGAIERWADTIDAEIRARGEPKAWLVSQCGPTVCSEVFSTRAEADECADAWDYPSIEPLFAAPPAPKIEVTDAMVSNLAWWLAQRDGEDAGLHFYEDSAREMLEAALKETP